MLRVSFEEMNHQFLRVLLKIGFAGDQAELCARLFAETSRDGVYSHGLNRFPRFINYIKKGFIDIHAHPEKLIGFGALERWDGKLGPGNLNASFSMNRAMELADQNGFGCVALSNTNHWMRGGSYGWQAAESDYIGICWTTTCGNMPAWGAKECILGNNPLIIAVPRPEGHIVLDMALSQFSYGKMETYSSRQERLPVLGGYDSKGNLTNDPGEILKTQRPLPIGYWKGSGLSLLLELVAVALSGGIPGSRISMEAEYAVSQIFIAFSLVKLSEGNSLAQTVNEIIDNLHQAAPEHENGKVYYPGEKTLLTRAENLAKGIPVDEAIWKQVLEM
jgi:3-dehydro-L-gulonate 2-dehydrogenase